MHRLVHKSIFSLANLQISTRSSVRISVMKMPEASHDLINWPTENEKILARRSRAEMERRNLESGNPPRPSTANRAPRHAREVRENGRCLLTARFNAPLEGFTHASNSRDPGIPWRFAPRSPRMHPAAMPDWTASEIYTRFVLWSESIDGESSNVRAFFDLATHTFLRCSADFFPRSWLAAEGFRKGAWVLRRSLSLCDF